MRKTPQTTPITSPSSQGTPKKAYGHAGGAAISGSNHGGSGGGSGTNSANHSTHGASGGGGGSGSNPPASSSSSSSGNIKVVVRVRPPNQQEKDKGGTICVSFPSEDSIEINQPDRGPATMTYDRVFDPDATQQEVFLYVAKPIVADLMEGYNGTIFAYGQTSSGKTFTMEGPDIHDKQLAGVIPRTVREIFESVADSSGNLEFAIKVSYIEIYMERIRCLLDSFGTKSNLQVREDTKQGVYVSGATEEYVTSEAELLGVMADGAKNRAVAATGMNSGSSRSHSVFIITLQQTDVETGKTKTGMLYMVDLAGSEMVKKTHATGQVLEEAKTINKSLSSLGQVINALTDGKSQHVPYRDSKLTRILQNSLGGNSKTCLVVNCSPSSFNALETVSTLRFGSRAKRIQNKAVINETRTVAELSALLAKAESALELQQTYIVSLEARVKKLRGGGGGAGERGSNVSIGGADDAVVARALSAEGVEVEGGGGDGDADEAAEGGGGGGRGLLPPRPPPKVRRKTEDEDSSGGDGDEGSAAGDGSEEEEDGEEGEDGDGDDDASDDASDVATQALQAMAAKVEEARAQLEEEKKESDDLRKENDKLMRWLKDKEIEVKRSMVEADRQCLEMKERLDAIEAEKADLTTELTRGQNALQESTERSKFKMQETNLMVEKLMAENERLASEVRAYTGDSVDKAMLPSATLANMSQPPSSPATSSPQQAPAAHSPERVGVGRGEGNGDGGAGHKGGSSASGGGNVGHAVVSSSDYSNSSISSNSSNNNSSSNNRASISSARDDKHRVSYDTDHGDELDDDDDVGLNDELLEGLNMDPIVLEIVKAKERKWRAEAAQLRAASRDNSRQMMELKREFSKRLEDNEEQRARLTKDNIHSQEKAMQLQQIVDAMSDESGEGDKTQRHTAMLKSQNESLRQRLEQLVAVHRQLLRKFAQLELENGDYRKKIQLRDTRMLQLEANLKTMADNNMGQAQRHALELRKVRDQMSALKEDHKALEALHAANITYPHERRMIRGGADHAVHEVKTLRGGGGGSSVHAGRHSMPAGSVAPGHGRGDGSTGISGAGGGQRKSFLGTFKLGGLWG